VGAGPLALPPFPPTGQMVLTGSPRGRDGPGPARGPDRARRDSAAARLARPGL